MNTWIVVAHRAGARFVDEQDDELRIFDSMDFPQGRARDSERGGDGASSDRRGADASGHAATIFAAQIADRLHKGRTANRYQELVLIAAPRFLGVLRQALDSATASLVRGTLDKDFGGLSDRELLERLDKL
jgi:protein required for attachment to host cells